MTNPLIKLSTLFPKGIALLLHLGFSIVSYYHLFSHSIFFNIAFEETGRIEWLANQFLAPVHYLCGGQIASYNSHFNEYDLTLRFDYHSHKKVYAPLAIYTFAPGFCIGTALKALSFLDTSMQKKHALLQKQLDQGTIRLHNDFYRSLGIEINDFTKSSLIDSRCNWRRKEDRHHLAIDKRALSNIIQILHREKIPFWVDCGTLMGAYNYEGVIPWDYDIDIGIIAKDSENVYRALQKLDRSLYHVQDWSSRGKPHSYLRVYLKENHHHIDIFHYAIDPIEQTFTFILSYEESAFMAKEWKMREKAHVKPLPFHYIFPLKQGIFDEISVPVPNQTPLYLQMLYSENLDPVRIYNPEKNQYEKNLSHSYWKLPLRK